jgi:hypothetical protein
MRRYSFTQYTNLLTRMKSSTDKFPYNKSKMGHLIVDSAQIQTSTRFEVCDKLRVR